MKKIPTLFVRDKDNRKYVTDVISPNCQWVFEGEGVATRKYDGTCVMYDGEYWWARREIKNGGRAPDNYRTEDTDYFTGKTVGWEPIEQSSFHKFFGEAVGDKDWEPGTYELIGPKVNANPEGVETHQLIKHGEDLVLRGLVPTYDSIREGLALLREEGIEGIVWHHPNGLRAKIKVKDFNWDD